MNSSGNGWRELRLKHVVRSNPTKAEIKGLSEDLAVSFVPMEAVGEYGGLDLTQERPLGEISSGYTYFRDGDVVVAKITPCFENGKGALAKGLQSGIGFGTTELHVLRPQDVDARFLFYLTISDRFRKLGAASMYGAGGQKRISEEFVEGYRVAIPSLDVQRATASFLDRETARIDSLIEKKRRLLDLLEEKRESRIAGFVDGREYPVVKLGHLIEVLSGFAFPSSGFTRSDEDVRLLRGTNVGVGHIDWTDTVRWPREDADRYSHWLLAEGDIVFGMDRPWISGGIRVARIGESDLPALLLQRVARIRPKRLITPGYLQLVLSSPQFRAYFEPILTGVSVPHISPSQISAFRLPLPPLEHQQEAVAALLQQESEAHRVRSALRSSISLVKEHRTALISAAVRGKAEICEKELA